MTPDTRFTFETLHSFSHQVMVSVGASEQNATIVADHLAGSNLVGHDSHGVHRLEEYVNAIQEGRVDPRAIPTPIHERATTAVYEAVGVLGQVAGALTTEQVIVRALEQGTAVVTARNANHIGRAGVYAMQMANAGLVGQVYCSGNGSPLVAPWGSTERRLATNPIAIAVPTAGEPILVDVTTSVTAEGKIRVARNAGKRLPPDQILDREGNPSNRPEDLYAGGSILPLGAAMGHKGYGLSVIVDLLGALLGGAGAANMDTKFSNNFSLWAADPEALGGRTEMERLQQEYFTQLKSATPKTGVDEIFLPGEPEQRTAEARTRDGLPLDAGTVTRLDGLADHLGLTRLSRQKL